MYDKTEGIIREFMDEGRLSRRKLKHLQEVHERTMDQVFKGHLITPHIAPSELCEGTRLPTGAYWCEVVARVLDMDALFKWQEDCRAKGVEPFQAIQNIAPRWHDLVAEAAEYLDLWDEDYLDREWWKIHQDSGATDADYEEHLKQEEQDLKAMREAINSI